MGEVQSSGKVVTSFAWLLLLIKENRSIVEQNHPCFKPCTRKFYRGWFRGTMHRFMVI